MAVTTSYGWSSLGSSFILNDEFTAGDQIDPVAASNAAGDRYFAAWGDPTNSNQVNGRIVNADQSTLTGEFTVHNTANAATEQYDPSVAGLTGGNFVVTYTDLAADPSGDIRARLYTPGGNPLGSDFAIDNGAFADTQSSVSALSGGGFVVTFTRNVGLGNTDIRARLFDQNGNQVSGAILDASAGGQTASSVAGLSSGGFVAVWQDLAADEVYFRRFQSNGTALDANRVLIDTGGTINRTSMSSRWPTAALRSPIPTMAGRSTAPKSPSASSTRTAQPAPASSAPTARRSTASRPATRTGRPSPR